MFLDFRLNPDLKPARLADDFRATGRLSIHDFLDVGHAERLAEYLGECRNWVEVMNAGDRVFELPEGRRSELDADTALQLDTLVNTSARDGFQYRYDTIRVPDAASERADHGTVLDRFAAFMSSPEVIALFRTVTGADDITFADAQATRYRPGHFLTGHNDDVAGKHRRAAYVFGLTARWRVEWGGLLLFHRDDASVDGFAPAFNSLRLFSVPTLHSVSLVTPFAGPGRTSVTGWLRADA